MKSALPSVDPFSTTMTSLPGTLAVAARTEGRYFSSRSRPFQLGITTEAVRLSGRESVREDRGGLSRQMRSQRASESTDTRRTRGEHNANGSPARRRHVIRRAVARKRGINHPPEDRDQ